MQIDRDSLLISKLDDLILPSTKYNYPDAESDYAMAEQVYLLGTANIAGDILYVLAYSEDGFWVERTDLSPYRK